MTIQFSVFAICTSSTVAFAYVLKICTDSFISRLSWRIHSRQAKPNNTMGAVPKEINHLYPIESMQTAKSISILLCGNLLGGFMFWSGVYF